MKIANLAPAQAITNGPRHHFFGYYDKCPWSASGAYILTMAAPFMDHFPQNEPADIGLLDVRNGFGFRFIARTRAWNWQQGAMLQWLPSNPDRYVIYNDITNKDLKSIILDIKTGTVRSLPKPIAAVDHSGTMALSLNFGRLYDTRNAYGYYGAADPWLKELHPADDGIYIMDLDSGSYRLIVSLDQIAGFEPTTTRRDVKHWFNHLSFNPDSTRFCFLHRFEIPEISHFGTRLFTARPDGSDLRCLWRGQISHFDWFNDEQLIAWILTQRSMIKANRIQAIGFHLLKRNARLRKTLKRIPIIKQRLIGGRFALLKDRPAGYVSYDTVGDGILTEDGHCTYSPDRQWILMDLYPDIRNCRRLLIYSNKSNQRIDIGNFYSPPQLREEIRCDLHARWNRDGSQICIDSTHEGMRQMYIVDVKPIVQKI